MLAAAAVPVMSVDGSGQKHGFVPFRPMLAIHMANRPQYEALNRPAPASPIPPHKLATATFQRRSRIRPEYHPPPPVPPEPAIEGTQVTHPVTQSPTPIP